MKKILFSLFTLLFVGLGFCSAGSYTYTGSFDFQKNRSTAANIQYTYLKFYVPLKVSSRDFDTIYLNCSIFDLNYGNTDFYNFLSSGTGAVSVSYSTPSYSSSSYNYPSFLSTTLQTGYSLNGLTNFSYSFDSNYLSSLTDNYSNYSFVSYVSFDLTRITKNSSEFNMTSADGYLNFKYSCVVSGSSVLSFTGVDYSCPSCPTCPDQYSSLECQTEYNLIPISSVDQNYCINNSLCPSSGGGDCGTGSINWSSLFINDIQHLGKPIISIDIPEEINWDYSSTDTEFNVEVIGYNVDYEKMNQVLSIQKYIPSSEDFTQVVGILAPYMKILVFVLFVYIVIRRLKKPFSSKMK